MNNVKHKVFISYYHADDQWYKNYLLEMNLLNEIFQDYSVHEDEIDDSGLTDERIREIIRDDYIKDATVLILLCGMRTATRKFIDWELRAAMFNTEKNPKLGILIINLPGVNYNTQRANGDDERNIIGKDIHDWIISSRERKSLELSYPHMPSRIIDNFVSGVPISVVNWERIKNNPVRLIELIDIAYDRRLTNVYDNTAPLWGRNR